MDECWSVDRWSPGLEVEDSLTGCGVDGAVETAAGDVVVIAGAAAVFG
jgi:hypothetical protein